MVMSVSRHIAALRFVLEHFKKWFFKRKLRLILTFLAGDCWWKSHVILYFGKPLFDIVLTCVTGCIILDGTFRGKGKKKKGKAWKSLSKTYSCFTTMKACKFQRKKRHLSSDSFLEMAVVHHLPVGTGAR